MDRGSERAVDREIEGDHDGTEERKVNGEFNLVWQPPFPLRRKKRNERKRERGGGRVRSKFSNFIRVRLGERVWLHSGISGWELAAPWQKQSLRWSRA